MMMPFAAGLGAQLQDGQRRRVVDEHVQLAQRVRRVGNGAPVRLLHLAGAQARQVHAGFGAQDTLHQLRRAHLQREKGDGCPSLGRVRGQVQCERRLAHAGSGREDHQVAATEAVEQVVHVLEPAGDAGHGVLLLGQLRQLLERLG